MVRALHGGEVMGSSPICCHNKKLLCIFEEFQYGKETVRFNLYQTKKIKLKGS